MLRAYVSLVFGVLLLAPSTAQNLASSLYPPVRVPCTKGLKVRPAVEGLAPEESTWREKRLKNVVQSLHSYLPRANITGFNHEDYLNSINASNAPIVGLAISGGGTQSGLGGLGVWQAFDERYPPAVKAGIGGLTQCLSYITGLSGGGCVTVASLASNNFSSIAQLRENVNFTTNYIVGPTGNVTEYFTLLYENAYAKFAQGFPVSVVDIFGQFWRQYLPKSWGYKNYSDIALLPDHAFALGLGPMPMFTLAEIVPGSSPNISNIMYPGLNSSKLSSYELTPFEFGSWVGGRVQAFMSTHFLGSVMNKGQPMNSKSCVVGFDKMTFMQGSTANAFNFWFIDDFFGIPLFAKRDKVIEMSASLAGRATRNNSIIIPPDQKKNELVILVEKAAELFNQSFNQSLWSTLPNPFLNYNKAMTGVEELLLVDGSETGETIPLRPLMQKERKVDFIIAYDSGGDGDYNWVNGTVLLDSSATAAEAGLPFPAIPDATTMINLQMNKYPTFFGCNAPADVPLVLYIPNAPWNAYTNYTYTTPSFTDNQLDLVFANNLASATYGHGTIDANWPACLACGVIARSLVRVNLTIPDICHNCFQRHCWNGTRAETPSKPVYDPKLILDPQGPDYAVWNATVWN